MRICVYGAGAVGSYLAALLCRGEAHVVTVVARGAQYQAIADQGITLVTDESSFCVRPHAVSHDASGLPPQDLVFVTTKAHAQAAAAADIAALLGPQGCAVFVCNGIPWWWSYRGPSAPGHPLALLDPGAALWQTVQPQRALGCVVYSANELQRPGVVQHRANNRWLIGEPDATASPRLATAVRLLVDAGLHAEARMDIRADIWRKLLRNAALNPVCALTRLSVGQVMQDTALRAQCIAVVEEVAAVAAMAGHDLSADVSAARQAGLTGAVHGGGGADVRPSMLQDVIQGKPTEVEAILGQLQCFARASGVPTPTVAVLLALVRGLGRG